MKRKSELYLRDILEAIETIRGCHCTFEELKQERIIRDGIVRNLEIIGEAAGQIPAELQRKYPAVPWADIRRFRNVVVHKYWGVDVDILWDIIQNKLESLKEQIRHVLENGR